MNWTAAQKQAIWGRGGDLLLSAAAGSGKTAVLSERALCQIADLEQPIDIERLLIVTFTRSAAAEMKERIAKKLMAASLTAPSNRQLQRQLAKLPYANISTIHSFCLDLVRQYFQQLHISPTLRVGEDSEIKVLEREILEEIISQRYSQQDKEDFLALVEYLSGGKNDEKLVSSVLQIYNFLRSLPFYKNWCKNRLQLYDATSIEESIWGQVLLSYCHDLLVYAIGKCKEGLEYTKGDDLLQNNYGVPLSEDLILLENLKDLVEKGLVKEKDAFVGTQNILRSFKHRRLGAKKGVDDLDKDYLSGIRNTVKDCVLDLKEHLLICNKEEFLEDIADLRQKMTMLFDLALTLDEKVWEKKKETAVVDFSDLEHLTLQLLLEPTEVYGEYKSTILVEALQSRFDEIMVDECQDINEVQDLIFRTLSKDNLFMVGDVKQSIYSFRQARPELFVEKLKKAAYYDEVHFPAKILLSNNFRSRATVTDTINKVCSRLMTEDLGGVDYGEEEYLYPAAPYAPCENTGWEMHYIDQGTKKEEESRAYQSMYIASYCHKLIRSGHQVSDGKGGTRPVEYGDIAVLLRSPKASVAHYRKSFAEFGISIHEDIGESFLETTEIRTILNFLKVIDNPLLDVELLGVLRSPIGGFTGDEIAEIRSQQPRGRLYHALSRSSSPKAQVFLKRCSDFRRKSGILSVSALVMEIYQETSIHLIYRGMEKGERRYRNLMLLCQYIEGWQNRGCNGLTAVLLFVDSILARGDDLPAAQEEFSSDSITLMSIHKSKGLEFPVVILGETTRRFNKQDINASVVLDNHLGFTAMRRDHVEKRQFKTLPLLAARIKATENLISEEMRVLYVALTRAREKLVVVGMVKDPIQYIHDKATPLEGGKIPAYQVLNQSSYLQMLTTALASDDLVGDSSRDGFKLVLASGDPITIPEGATIEGQKEVALKAEEISLIKEQIAYCYPYPHATLAPTKLSVSELAGKEFEGALFGAKPRFAMGSHISGAERGTAVHAFMQLCDLQRASLDVEAELRYLLGRNILTKRQGQAVDIGKIKAFFRSDLWKMIQSSDRYLREYRFVSYLREEQRGEFPIAEDGEKTVLQGISDLVLIRGSHAILVDFKTDRVQNGQRLVELYQGQMKLYKAMLSDTLKVTVERAILYSFHLEEIVEL